MILLLTAQAPVTTIMTVTQQYYDYKYDLDSFLNKYKLDNA